MTRDAEHLVRLVTLENGKALTDARGEVTHAAEFFRVVSAILHDPRVCKLSFTDSTEVGQLCSRRRPTRSSTARRSSPATRRSSSSPTRTSTRPSRTR
jgi:acyl-CoA reductase-like NAD-dependent aldehyde dehydrogenase